jgi:hypothetical protein
MPTGRLMIFWATGIPPAHGSMSGQDARAPDDHEHDP